MKYTIQEVKEFIKWAKKEKIQAFELGDVKVSFYHGAFIDDIMSPSSQTNSQEVSTETNQNTAPEDEELFWSAKS